MDRKQVRLTNYDYSQNGAYFITICTKDMENILSSIVGDGALDVPLLTLSEYGKTVENEIVKMNGIYEYLYVTSYIIMPNHVHFLIVIDKPDVGTSGAPSPTSCVGTSRAPSPTNSIVARYVSTLKRMTNKKCGVDLWQRSYYDHIIRNDEDYVMHLQYIDENPKKWLLGKDEYYT